MQVHPNASVIFGDFMLKAGLGQRYSFILEANRPIDNYRICAIPSNGANGLELGCANGTNSAILRYKGAQAIEPTGDRATSGTLLDESQLHPLTDPKAPELDPECAECVINLNIGFQSGLFTINNATYKSPPTPVLLQILRGAPPESLLPAGSIYPLPRNKTIEVTIPGRGNGTNPASDDINN